MGISVHSPSGQLLVKYIYSRMLAVEISVHSPSGQLSVKYIYSHLLFLVTLPTTKKCKCVYSPLGANLSGELVTIGQLSWLLLHSSECFFFFQF